MRLVLYPNIGGDRLTTLIHEIAHHISREKRGRAIRSRGGEFARWFKWGVSQFGGFIGFRDARADRGPMPASTGTVFPRERTKKLP